MHVDQPINGVVNRSANEDSVSTVMCGDGHVVCPSPHTLQLAQGSEARADFFAEELRLLPGREVAAPVGLVEVDQVVVGLLRPATRRLVNLTWKDRYGSRDGDVDGP